MKKTDGFIHIEASRVLEAATAIIREIEEQRQENVESLISEVMRRPKPSWLKLKIVENKFNYMSAETREDAIKIIVRMGDGFWYRPYDDATKFRDDAYRMAKMLMKAAEVALTTPTATMMIDLFTAGVLKSYL